MCILFLFCFCGKDYNNSKKMWKCLKDPNSAYISPHTYVIKVNEVNITHITQVLLRLCMNFSSHLQQSITNLDIPQQTYSEEANESRSSVNYSQFSLQPVTLDCVMKEIDHFNKDKTTDEDDISC